MLTKNQELLKVSTQVRMKGTLVIAANQRLIMSSQRIMMRSKCACSTDKEPVSTLTQAENKKSTKV